MKKLLLFLSISLISFTATAQIKVVEQPTEIGSIKLPMMPASVKLSLYKDGTYCVLYKDVQYTHITDYKSFSIKNEETLINFYDILLKQFDAPKNTELMIEFDETMIIVKTNKMLGQSYLQLYIDTKGQPMGTFNIERKYLDKLFGK